MFNLFVVGVKGESLGVRNLERGNTKLNLKDVPSLCSGGVDFRGVVCYDCKVGEAVERWVGGTMVEGVTQQVVAKLLHH